MKQKTLNNNDVLFLAGFYFRLKDFKKFEKYYSDEII